MTNFEKLYEEDENAKVRFVGFITEYTRYDFGIVYTSQFFGKPLVVCMQTGRSTLLDPNDLEDIDYLQSAFKIDNYQDAADLAEFLYRTLPSTPFEPQYD
jgi:Protein of unknown function (DUF3055)